MKNIKVKKLTGFWEKSWGLLRYQKAEPIFFQTRFGIHTFGMKYPIDVIICDKNMVVKCLKENLQPNRFFSWNPIFSEVIELPEGTISNEKIKIGEFVNLILN